MGLIKTALIGAAVYAGVQYLTKKDPITGRSIVDDLVDKAPEWMEKAKDFKADAEERIRNASSDIQI